jgi:anti-anti-sigma factor
VNCTTQIEGSKGILRLEGRFTFEVGPDFKAQASTLLEAPGVTELQLDFKGVTHMEASSLGLLLLVREQAEAKSARVVILSPSPGVRVLLDRVQFGRLLEIQD